MVGCRAARSASFAFVIFVRFVVSVTFAFGRDRPKLVPHTPAAPPIHRRPLQSG
jgi:hypothetical protein